MQRKYKDITTDDMIGFLRVLDIAFADIEYGMVVSFKDSSLKQKAFDAFNELRQDYFTKADNRLIQKTGEVGTVELTNIKLEL